MPEKTAGDMVWKEAFPICSDMLGAVTWHHSHHTPAYVIARHAEHVFPLETCMTSDLDKKCMDPRTGNMQDNLVKFLKEKISDKIEYKEMNVVHRGTEVGESVKPVVRKCWTNGHISDDDLNNFKAGARLTSKVTAIPRGRSGGWIRPSAASWFGGERERSAQKNSFFLQPTIFSSSSSSKSSSSRRGQSTTRKLLSINDWTSKLFGSDTTTKVSEVVPSKTARTGKARQHGVRVSDFTPHLGTDEEWPVVEAFGHEAVAGILPGVPATRLGRDCNNTDRRWGAAPPRQRSTVGVILLLLPFIGVASLVRVVADFKILYIESIITWSPQRL